MRTIYLMLIGLVISIKSNAQYESYAMLADRAQDKLYSSFRSSSGTYYIENNGTTNTYFHYWWNAHALDVLIDAYQRTNDSKYLIRINTLVDNWSNNNGGTIYKDYYDDMEWFALSLFRAYEVTGNSTFLTMSTNLWDDIKTGKNSNQGGGIAWRKSQLDYKNVPANAPAIIYACRRHQKWGHSWELDLATELYTWLKNTLRESSGRINDGINREGNGQIDYWQFTYNHGTFIGAALEMYQSTGNSTYLNDAIATADYAIQSADMVTNGIFKNEGDRDASLFKGILVRYLSLLAQEAAVPGARRNYYLDVLENQALSIHHNGFNRAYDLIGQDWALSPGSSTWMSAQLSGLMMLEVAADLGFTSPTPPVIVYEHCSYGGWAVPLGEGSYTMNQLQALGIPNDQASSIKVRSGYTVTVYEHYDFTGNSLVKTGDDSCLDNEGFNDEISSMIISQSGSRVTGEEEDEVKINTMIYPDPVVKGELLKVQFSHQSGENPGVYLLDLMGKQVLELPPVSGAEVLIPTGDLSAGTYFLQLVHSSNVETRKVIVK